MRFLNAGLVICMLALASCASQPPPAPQVDIGAARTDLMAADRAWSESTNDMEKFLSFFADDGVFFPEGAPMAKGKEAIRDVAASMFSSPGFGLTWQATSGEVAMSGDLGYTIGTYEVTMSDPEGNPSKGTGHYVTVWEKQADGDWKAVADIGTPDAPPPASE